MVADSFRAISGLYWKDEMYGAFYDFTFDNKVLEEMTKIDGKTDQELWLAFVMHELHNKKRDGEKWHD